MLIRLKCQKNARALLLSEFSPFIPGKRAVELPDYILYSLGRVALECENPLLQRAATCSDVRLLAVHGLLLSIQNRRKERVTVSDNSSSNQREVPSRSNRFGPMDRLAQHLPFAVDDFGTVNEYFANYLKRGDDSTSRVLDVWTYCFVRRYFVGKCLSNSAVTAADLESMIDSGFVKIRKGRSTVATGRYAQWVSVVCRNTFLNFVRSRRTMVSLDEPSAPPLADESLAEPKISVDRFRGSTREVTDETGPGVSFGSLRKSNQYPILSTVAESAVELDWDAARTREAVAAAINRLPRYLQEIATMKVLDGLSYQQMSDRLSRPIPILRSYGHRTIIKLRKDAALRKFFFDDG